MTAVTRCACLAAVVGLAATHTPPTCLEIWAHGRVVWQGHIKPGEHFDVAFVHSQERTRWVQHYVAGPDATLWQDGSTFRSYGAGMPSGATHRSPDGFTVTTRRRLVSVAMLNSRTAQLTLHYRGRTFAIGQWFGDYEPFEIRVQ